VEQQKRRRDPTLWHRINRLLTGLIFVAVVLFAGADLLPRVGPPQPARAAAQREEDKLRAEQLLQKKREREVTLLQTDPSYVEVIARDKLGVMKEGETIFRLDGSRTPAVEASTPAPQKK